MSREILLVEDSTPTAMLYHAYLTKVGYRVRHAARISQAQDFIREQMPDLVLLDQELPDGLGTDFLTQLKSTFPEILVVMVTANGSVDLAVEAMRKGAYDFIQKPFSPERLTTTLRNALTAEAMKREIKRINWAETGKGFHNFIGSSASMQAVFRTIEQVAKSRVPVFITGESGTGKELAAQALHDISTRRDKTFRALNCAAIPKDLLESELFGHVKGAFTGATQDRQGAAQAADGGTLFLDEICEMPLELQSKLLRLIQTQCVQPVGSDKEIKIDVRFIAATNKNPQAAVEAGLFREDLFYRLYVVPVEMPPLRDRGEDVGLLADFFLEKYAAEEGKSVQSFSAAARQKLLSNAWPGNVRQLENTIRYAVAVADGSVVDEVHLPAIMATPNMQATSVVNGSTAVQPLWQTERQAIETALKITDNDITQAAALLEVAPSTIYRKLAQWK